MAVLQQIWNGETILSEDRNRHKLDVDTFIEKCAGRNVILSDAASQGSGMYTLKVTHTRPEADFNIIYQDLRSGDKENDARKRLQLSHIELKPNEQYFYVGGYNAGDKYIMVAFLTQTREINDTASTSSRWIEWEPFDKTYWDGIHLWSKNEIVYLGCTADNADLFWNALATRSRDGYVPAYAAASGIAKTTQKILFGAPGTGKSHKVKEETHGQLVHRVTFHPDTDYASFVGSYKPAMEGNKIVYRFVPQVFAKAYCRAWNEYLKPVQEKAGVCLLIEELNRGNCAQIFGDIFQILDRKKETGFSEYSVEADQELATYLRSEISDFEQYYNTIRKHSDLNDEGDPSIMPWDANGVNQVLLCLPPNMSIICTMNTSDQSLFPMDSAFKRRWEWEYVPIHYNLNQSDFRIAIDPGHKYSWSCFLKKLNDIIYEQTRSEDKQMGNFFIKGDENMEVDCSQFVSKVMYFLWSEICKDNPKARKAIFLTTSGKIQEDGTPVPEEFTFSMLFPTDGHPSERTDILAGFFNYHGIENIADEEPGIPDIESTTAIIG